MNKSNGNKSRQIDMNKLFHSIFSMRNLHEESPPFWLYHNFKNTLYNIYTVYIFALKQIKNL